MDAFNWTQGANATIQQAIDMNTALNPDQNARAKSNGDYLKQQGSEAATELCVNFLTDTSPGYANVVYAVIDGKLLGLGSF